MTVVEGETQSSSCAHFDPDTYYSWGRRADDKSGAGEVDADVPFLVTPRHRKTARSSPLFGTGVRPLYAHPDSTPAHLLGAIRG